SSIEWISIDAVNAYKEFEEAKHKEWVKCQQDPVYMYNTYIKPKDARPINKEEWERMIELSKAERLLKGRKGNIIGMYPLTPEESFKNETEGCKGKDTNNTDF